ncbi:MAG: hypothetical protein HQL55_20215, partial [Magnetococcales bacterium]|nr:hypothetical protein [Magnetococcales bacterium]
GTIESLGANKIFWPQDPRKTVSYWKVIQGRLGVNPMWAGGMARIHPGTFSDYYVEKVDGRVGFTYPMKYPFSGFYREFIEGSAEGTQNVTYEPGAVTWDEAYKRACDQALSATSMPCENNSIGLIANLLYRDENDKLFYIVILRRRETPITSNKSSVDYEYLTYMVNSHNGEIVLTERSPVMPNNQKWLKKMENPSTLDQKNTLKVPPPKY